MDSSPPLIALIDVPYQLFEHNRNAPVVRRSSDPGNFGPAAPRENGSVEDGFKQAARILEGEYEFPIHSPPSLPYPTAPGATPPALPSSASW